MNLIFAKLAVNSIFPHPWTTLVGEHCQVASIYIAVVVPTRRYLPFARKPVRFALGFVLECRLFNAWIDMIFAQILRANASNSKLTTKYIVLKNVNKANPLSFAHLTGGVFSFVCRSTISADIVNIYATPTFVGHPKLGP